MTPSRSPATLAAAAAVALLLAGCTGGTSVDRADGGYVLDGEYGITVVPPADRDEAPTIAGQTLVGEPLSLEDFAGQTVVLNVWGSWCGPCVDEADDLVEAERQLADVAFVGLNIRESSTDNAQAFERAFDITWPSIFDQDSSLLLAFRDTDLPPPQAPPTTYVIDTQGRLGARIAIDDVTATTLVDVVEEVRGDG